MADGSARRGFSYREARLWVQGRGARLLDLLYPPRCPVTDEPVDAHGAFAPSAWSRARLLAPPWCEACGLPFALADPATPLCAPCAAPSRYEHALTGPRRMDSLRSAFAYDEVAARLVLSLKYGDRHDTLPALGRLLARAGVEAAERADVVVPVPLHPRRLRARRFNQAALLADTLALRTGLSHDPLALARVKPSPKQKGLSASQRRRNVQAAFAPRREGELAGLRVLLVDDVLTTGATLTACARAARKAGAVEVHGLTLARVVRDGATLTEA